MGSVAIWGGGDILTVRVYKRLSTAPDKVWANSYEVRVAGDAPGGEPSNEDLATLLGTYESTFHLQDVQFVRAVISTYVQDGAPYNPASFTSVSLDGINGGVSGYPADERQPLNMCLRVSRQVAFGRRGFSLYRRTLAEDQVTSPAGTPALTSAAAIAYAALVEGSFTYAGGESAKTVFGHLADLGLDLVMASGAPDATSVRLVTGLSVAGVTIKAFNNRYFDRA